MENTGSKITLNEIRNLERELNLSIPESFIDFQLKYNGGTPSKSFFILNEEPWVISKFLTLEEIRDTHQNLFDLEIIYKNELICIGETIGSSILCTKKNTGEIYLVDFGYDDIYILAKNISEFLSYLKSESEIN